MAGKSASLLTQTQRSRLTNEFTDVDEDAKRRDQQLIRERIRSGVLDFQLLADYPDRQYELAFDDLSERELRAALADTYLAVERIRDLHRYDRDQLLVEARARAEDVAVGTTDVRSLDRLDLRTTAEVRQQLKDRHRASRWEQRAIGLVKLAGGVGIVSILLLFVYAFFYRPLNLTRLSFIEEAVLGGSVVLAVLLGVVSVLVIAVHALRYDITPALMTLARQSRKMSRAARRRWGQKRDQIGGDDRTAWTNWAQPREETSAASTSTDPPLDQLRQYYAVDDLTDEQIERQLERVLETDPSSKRQQTREPSGSVTDSKWDTEPKQTGD